MKDNGLIEFRWHGRGGQGAKTACLLLADAAFSSGKFVQGFPEYGPERMGAPITAYNRISDARCSIHCNIDEPDYVVVVDETLLDTVEVTRGLAPQGAVIVNTAKSPAEIRPKLSGWGGKVSLGRISAGDLAVFTITAPWAATWPPWSRHGRRCR